MSGYSAMGKNPAAIAPSSTMMIEITQARTGRSMKKRANMGVTWVQEPGIRGQELGLVANCQQPNETATGDWSLASTNTRLLPFMANSSNGSLSDGLIARTFCTGHVH